MNVFDPYTLQPGQVWEFGNTATVYLVKLSHRATAGHMWFGLNVATGRLEQVFFRRQRFNGWTQVA